MSDAFYPDYFSHSDDPAYVLPAQRVGPTEVDEDSTPDMLTLLKSQARLAMTLQKRVESDPTMEVRELKDMATACSSLVTGVHRAGEMLRTLETYKLFHSVTLAFLKTRSDTLGEDLLSELKNVADSMNAKAKLNSLL
jgi:hypothetical protein